MNNSSAYSNVLLKPSAQTQAAQAPVPKRNSQDDQTSVNFQQNFKDAHDDVRERDEQIRKPAATKKTAQVDSKSTHNAEKKSSESAKQADENTSSDQISDNEKNADSGNSLSKQASDDQNTVDKKAESKSADKKICNDEISTVDPSIAGILLTNTNNASVPLPAASPVDVALASITVYAQLPADSEVNAETETQAETTKKVSVVNLSNPLAIEPSTSVAETIKGDGTSLIDKQAKTDQPSLGEDGEEVASNKDSSAAIALQLVADTPSPPVSTAASDVVAQTPEALAVVSSVVLPKSTLAQTALAPVTDDTSDADILSKLAEPLVTEKQSIKAASGNLNLPLAPDTSRIQAQVLDPKATFDKTLQNLLHPESNTLDGDATQPATPTPTGATTSSTNTLDSMLRFSDTQAPAARSFVVQTAVPVPVGQPQWSQAVGEKVLWLAAQNVSSAEIHLNPENLGPMQVKVSVNQEQTTINFTSNHAVVREVLDQNLGRLRDMFSEQGLNLVNVDVSDKSFSRQQGDSKDQKGQAGTKDIVIEDDTPVAISAIVQQRLVDHYA